jgi:flagellar hook-associated protein 2
MSAVDGLVSGMNTSEIIRQLLSLERQPVVRLQSKKAAADKAITALQGLNTKFLAIADLAKKLSGGTGWSPLKTTSSNPEAVGIAASPNAAPGTLSFKVTALATAHQTYSAGTYAAATTVVADAGASISIGYTDANGDPATLSFNNHDGTLQSIANAVNTLADSPVTARIVKTSDTGDYRLELTAKKTGAASAFTVSGIAQFPDADMTFTTAAAAGDAQILLGSSATPLSIKSATSTLSDVMPGVSLTLRKADANTTVTVDVARDTAALTADVAKLVDMTNEFLKTPKRSPATTPSRRRSGCFKGTEPSATCRAQSSKRFRTPWPGAVRSPPASSSPVTAW